MQGADLVDPFRRRVVRRVSAARHVIHEERLLRIERVDPPHPVDGVVGHGGGEVPARLADIGVDGSGVAEQVRLPLARVAADEAVEIVEPHAGRPLVERAGLARLERRRVVVLAEPGRAVAVLFQDLADRCRIAADEAVIAGIAGRLLGDHAEAHGMVVAAGDQRGARRRAQRGGMEIRVAQTVMRDTVEVRGRDDPAERAGRAEPDIVGHDQQDVGRTLGRRHARRPERLRLVRVEVDLPAERHRRRRQNVAGRRHGGRRRACLAVDRLGNRRRCAEEPEQSGQSRRADLEPGTQGCHGLPSCALHCVAAFMSCGGLVMRRLGLPCSWGLRSIRCEGFQW